MVMTKEIQSEGLPKDKVATALARKNVTIILGTDLAALKRKATTTLTPLETDASTHLTSIVSRLNKAMEGKYSTAITDKYHEEIKKIKPEE